MSTSGPGTTQPPPPPPPNPPTTPSLTASTSAFNLVSLSWSASTVSSGAPPLAGYHIFRNGSLLTSTTGISYGDTNVTGGVSYSYTVQAYDTTGVTSAQSNTATVTTPQAYLDTLTLGIQAFTSPDGDTYVGYFPDFGGTGGQLSPATLTGGKTAADAYDLCFGTCIESSVVVKGFSSDPGQSWLHSATANGVTQNGSSAQYSFSAGAATWLWSTPFGLPASGSLPLRLDHN